jgi:hypothetical protein
LRKRNKMPDNLTNIWGSSWDNFQQNIGKEKSMFIKEPVSTKTFFKDYLNAPLFPRQQRAVDKAFTNDCHDLSNTNEFYLGWGKRCVAAYTKLKDEITGEIKTIKEWAAAKRCINIASSFVNPLSGQHKKVVVKSGVPFKKGSTELFKVTTESGDSIVVSKEHLFRTKERWQPLKSLHVGDRIVVNVSPNRALSDKQEAQVELTEWQRDILLACTNEGRFTKGTPAWSKGKSGYLSPEARYQMGVSKGGKKVSLLTRLRKSVANKGLKHHKSNCSCSCCKTMRNESRFVCRPVKYKNVLFRSSWEASYAVYLDALGEPWLYEPSVFGTEFGNYIPDFYLVAEDKYVEIKGRMYPASANKIKSFKKLHPHIKFAILRERDLKLMGVI